MTTREAVYEMWRDRGMTTMFGNPGSTELPMLADFPSDFRYVLGLQEAVAVGMADGFAQASGTVGHVNLHTAPGVGNGMGAIFNAQANKTPLLVSAGQQVRSLMTLQANLTNKDATRMPHPLVKWSFEAARAEDVPHAIARGTYLASLPPRGPVFVSIPMDDWEADVDTDAVAHQTRRKVTGRQGPNPPELFELADKISGAKNPVMIAGPDIDACGGWDAAVTLAERQKLPVWATPAPGGGRIGFPEGHPLFRGILPPAIGPVGETLKDHDLVLVVGSSVFPYYPNIPGPLLAENTELIQITNDPDEAARAPMGDAILADPGLALEVLLYKIKNTEREGPDAPWPAPDPEESDPISASVAAAVLADLWPEDGILVLESPSSTLAMRSRLKLSKPGSYFFGAGGGLGFGLSASLGVQLAQPERQVVCVLGEGSVQYAVTAFWTAAAYDIPVKFLVLRNEEYAILKWFAGLENVEGAPALDLPALESAEIAKGYGVNAKRVDGRDELHAALTEGLAATGPRLVEVKVAPGMSLA